MSAQHRKDYKSSIKHLVPLPHSIQDEEGHHLGMYWSISWADPGIGGGGGGRLL